MCASYTRSLTFLAAVLAAAAVAQPACSHEHETVSRTLGDDLFMAGSEVRLAEGAAGDAVLAGGRVGTSGTVRGDEVVTGGEITLDADVGGNVYAAGGHVRLDGKVAHNARMAGGRVEVGSKGEVAGGLTVGGGEVEVNGNVGKYLQIAAGRARIDGHIAGDVDVAGGELSVGPATVIDGVLTYHGPHPAAVAAGAQIRGGTQYIASKGWGRAANPLRGFGVGAWLWLIGWMVAGSVVLALWPRFTRSVTDIALRHPWMALLLGFVVMVCVPVAVVLLIVSLVGIPLALLGFWVYLLLLPLGYLAAATALGDWLLPRIRRGAEIVTRQRILMLLGVLIVLFVLTRVPVLGNILGFLLITVGIGSLVMVGAARYREA